MPFIMLGKAYTSALGKVNALVVHTSFRMPNTGQEQGLAPYVRERIRAIGLRPLARTLGCNPATVKDWADGTNEPGARIAMALAAALGLRSEELFCSDEAALLAGGDEADVLEALEQLRKGYVLAVEEGRATRAMAKRVVASARALRDRIGSERGKAESEAQACDEKGDVTFQEEKRL